MVYLLTFTYMKTININHPITFGMMTIHHIIKCWSNVYPNFPIWPNRTPTRFRGVASSHSSLVIKKDGFQGMSNPQLSRFCSDDYCVLRIFFNTSHRCLTSLDDHDFYRPLSTEMSLEIVEFLWHIWLVWVCKLDVTTVTTFNIDKQLEVTKCN